MKVFYGTQVLKVRVTTVDTVAETTTEKVYIRRSHPAGGNDPLSGADFSTQIALNPEGQTSTVEVIENTISDLEYTYVIDMGDEIKDNFGGFYVPIVD